MARPPPAWFDVSFPAKFRRPLLLALLCGQATACRGEERPASAGPPEPTRSAAACPTTPQRSAGIPGIATRHQRATTWIDALGPGQADAVLVPAAEVAALNDRFSRTTGAWRDPSSSEVGGPEASAAAIAERLAYLRKQVVLGRYVEDEAGALDRAAEVTAGALPVDHQRLVLEETPLWCVPLEGGLFRPPIDRDFDRNRCASLHPAERVRVLRRSPIGGWLYVHAGHTVGWLREGTLSPRLSREHLDAWTTSRRLVPVRDDVATSDGFPIRLGVSVPLLEATDSGFTVLVPDGTGLKRARVPAGAGVHEGFLPLTRRHLWDAAFSELDEPYGWGGRAGERDCSRFLRDVFATFGIELARHSGVQAELGTHNVDLSGLDEAAKLRTIESWAGRGAVLLYMPGHIMLYLGREGDEHYAISSMSEYLEPCAGGPDTVFRVDRVAVTPLELGRGTRRTSFIERLTRLVAFAPGE